MVNLNNWTKYLLFITAILVSVSYSKKDQKKEMLLENPTSELVVTSSSKQAELKQFNLNTIKTIW